MPKFQIKPPRYYSAKYINQLIDIAQLNCWHWDLATDEIIDFGFLGPLAANDSNQIGTKKDFFKRVHSDDLADFQNKFQQAINEKKNFSHEFRVKDLNGQNQWIRSRGKLYFDSHGNPTHMMGVGIIITERIEKEESKSKMIYATKINSIYEVTSMLSHELKHPLMVMKAYLEGCILQLQEPDFNRIKILEVMKKISDNTSHLSQIIDNIKNVVHTGDLTYDKISLGELCNESIKLLKYNYNNKVISIHLNLHDKTTMIEIDVTQIKQVIFNLVQNSIEAMLEIGVEPTIEIKTKIDQSNKLEFHIKDRGPGISDEIKKKLFTSYSSTKPQGMGLGLAICRRIVSTHGGKLTICTDYNKGCCIKFTLDIAK